MLKHQVNGFRTICTVCGFAPLSLFLLNPYADAGDVYCVYNIRLKQYTACQVTRVEEHGGKKTHATLLALDWQGNKPLGAEELADLKPLYKDLKNNIGNIV
ncbi:hypothetical protein ACVWQG_07325 [Neisseria meningitidis]